MPDLLRILNIGRNAILAQTAVMNTRGQNIANVNTEGYSRQRAELTPGMSISTADGIFGTGVILQGIERTRDKLIDQQLIQERGSAGQYEFKSDALKFIEQLFNEPSDFGLNRMLNDFWNSWQDLANNPENQGGRMVVKESGMTLASGFNRIDRQLKKYIVDLNNDLQFKVEEVNRLAGQIAKMNKDIVSFEASGNEASDFRDRRDLLIDQLSKLANIKTLEGASGFMNVSIGGRFLVTEFTIDELSLATTSSSVNGPNVIWAADKNTTNITGGTIKGLMDIRDVNITDYSNQLDEFASTLAEQVNAIHITGYNNTDNTRNNFFNTNITGAGDFAVSTTIQNNSNLIATSAQQDTPGDNSTALAIADLQEVLSMNNGTTSFSDFYNSLISSIGAQTHNAIFLDRSFSLAVEKLEYTRESISGVSLDEEMLGLIEAQQAFTAATRFITTVDEMTQSILNMV